MPGKATSSRCSQAARLLVEDGEFGVVNSGGEVNGAADGTRTRDPRRDRPVFAIGVDTDGGARLCVAGDAAAVRRHLHVGGRRRGCGVRRLDGHRGAVVAGRVGNDHRHRLAIGQRQQPDTGTDELNLE